MRFPRRGRFRIDSVAVPGSGGRIGLCACPGLDTFAGGGSRTLTEDLRDIRDWGASGLVTLLEPGELEILELRHLPRSVGSLGLWWRHLPIRDMCAPDENFERAWAEEGERLKQILNNGGRFAVHCWAGLGRTGTVAARLLMECGLSPETAIIEVREARPGAIQSLNQEIYVRRLPTPE